MTLGIDPHNKSLCLKKIGIDPNIKKIEYRDLVPRLEVLAEGSILMLKKQDLGINSYVANIGSRDHFLTGIGGPWVHVTDLDFSVVNTIKKLTY